MSVALSVRALGKSFGELQALRDVSFDAHEREMVAVVGPNGAGKTTLLSIIAGTQSASTGSVSGPAPAGVSGREVGWAPQQPALYSKLSVAENIRLFARLEGVADPDREVERMLEQTGLSARADDLLGQLSGGNRQRVNVAVGLLGDPPVLALDEPSSALDPRQRERLWRFIRGLADAGTSVVFSTHNVGEAERYGDRVIVLDQGRMIFDGTPEALMQAAPAGAAGDFEQALVAFLSEGHEL
ncbi:MAG TPA: ABC transporter ATP-binding protein [Solirubrobacteraceae bacterium]|nr:ABC transporter ATP-binding protein [Solirubrobacteraceae bacterium]